MVRRRALCHRQPLRAGRRPDGSRWNGCCEMIQILIFKYFEQKIYNTNYIYQYTNQEFSEETSWIFSTHLGMARILHSLP